MEPVSGAVSINVISFQEKYSADFNENLHLGTEKEQIRDR
jgi:hypothetical protein